MVAFPPSPLVALAVGLERGFAQMFGLAPGATPVLEWRAQDLHRLLLGAGERVVLRARDATGIDRTMTLDMAGYRALAGRFRPHCR